MRFVSPPSTYPPAQKSFAVRLCRSPALRVGFASYTLPGVVSIRSRVRQERGPNAPPAFLANAAKIRLDSLTEFVYQSSDSESRATADPSSAVFFVLSVLPKIPFVDNLAQLF